MNEATDVTPYVTGLRDVSFSMELALTSETLDDLFASSGGAPRDVTLTYTHRWSRWRRWLNGLLRFMWWPLGPPKLPVSLEIHTGGMYVITQNESDGVMCVEMTSRRPNDGP